MVSRALRLQYSPRSQTSPNAFPTLLSILPFPPTVQFSATVSHGSENMFRNPLPPGASGTPVEPKEMPGTPPSLCPLCSVQGPQARGWQRDVLSAGLKLSHIPSPGTVILSAEALALRRARQAQRRAQQASMQLSKEQKELVRTLLGAHSRHVGTMFDQFVQFRVSIYRIQDEIRQKGCPRSLA